MDDFRTEVDEHGNIKVTSYIEAVVLSKEEQEQVTRIFKQLQEENDKLRELVQYIVDECYGDDWFSEQAELLGIKAKY